MHLLRICRTLERGVRIESFWSFVNFPGITTIATETSLQRLYSTFPAGSPGVGLLLLRIGVGLPLICFAMASLMALGSEDPVRVGLDVAGGLAGVLLVLGLWAPLDGGVIVVTQLWVLLSAPWPSQTYSWAHLLLPVMGAALTLLGPGAWSLDARLFGRKVFPDGHRTKGSRL